ncbi:MAG: zinc-ribbon domain-containing protein, partial [Clostridia bacterium]|nr:zinc-ribbon domain-containing protein [Clostridia bacterium]
MFCPNCGKELPDGTAFCTSCGANLTQQTPTAAQSIPEPEAFNAPDAAQSAPNAGQFTPDAAQFVPAPTPETPFNGAAAQQQPLFTGFDTLKKTFSSPLFLTMCILISVVAVFSVFQLSFNLYAILGTIACWMIYANAKSESAPLKQGGYKFAAIITRIIFVINWIIVGV